MFPVTEERIRVLYGETDKMGYVYNANYLFWFERARGTWFRERGVSYKEIEEKGLYFPLTEAHIRYKAPINYDDVVIVRAWVSDIKRASARFEYEIVNAKTGLVCTAGYTVHALVGRDGKVLSMPPDLKEILERDPKDWVTVE